MLKTSFASNLLKKLLLSLDVAEADEVSVGITDANYKDKTVQKSPSKNLNRVTSYLTSEARQAFI